MGLLSIWWSWHYQPAQHDTHEGTFLDSLSCDYKVLVIPTTIFIITDTDYHVAIKLKNCDSFCKIPEEFFLVKTNTQECFEFDKPVDILLNHLASLWDQFVNNNCSIQNSRIHFGQVTLVPISKQSVLQILCLTGQCCTKEYTLMFKELIQIFILYMTGYIEHK